MKEQARRARIMRLEAAKLLTDPASQPAQNPEPKPPKKKQKLRYMVPPLEVEVKLTT